MADAESRDTEWSQEYRRHRRPQVPQFRVQGLVEDAIQPAGRFDTTRQVHWRGMFPMGGGRDVTGSEALVLYTIRMVGWKYDSHHN